MISDSLERIVPDLMADHDAAARLSLRLHLERYAFASKHVQSGRLLDIACGVGYGAHLLLTENPSSITGIVAVDNDAQAIAYANKRYASELIAFTIQDAMSFTDAAGFHTIVSLETIEHLPQPELFLGSLYSMLLPGGVLIISAPVTPSKDGNPFHLHDFTATSFRKMLNKFNWKEMDSMMQEQSFTLRELQTKNNGQRTIRTNLLVYYIQHPVAILTRIQSLLLHGLKNKYLTVAFRKAPA